MDLPLKRVEEFLHQRTPLAKALNCQVVESTNKTLVLSIPKFANSVTGNDFSDIAAISICKLATWTFLQVALQRLDYTPHMKLESATWKTKRIIDTQSETITATCSVPSDKEWQQFLRMLSRKSRATVQISAVLSDTLGDSATLTCEYDTHDLDYA